VLGTLTGEVTFLYFVVALLVGGGLGFFSRIAVEQNQKIPMSVAHLTQGLLLVLPISNLQSSKGVTLLSPFAKSLASIMLPLS
jgi:hypothetical protein